ncbi:mitochondrial resolvase Ydc2 [Cladorrhinum sp. PSN332]|nr:mitochondrial resolvase Ydc2 [Cladorrhinum sp. PSN332]
MPRAKPPIITTTISSLTSAALSNLCNFCGLPKTGTKAALRLRLQQAAHSYQPVNNTPKILSIDLGLRNFAFSLVSPSSHSPPSIPPSALSFLHNGTSHSLFLPHISLLAWNRLDLTQNLSQSFSFSPSEMASLTINLVITHLLPLNPTHILIERQRFRSANTASVQEWTVRVNTLEAMLHAVFKILSTSSSSTPVLEVSSVTPKLIAGYLFPSAEDAPTKANGKKLQAYHILKKNKVEMLGKWLAEDKLIVAGNKDMDGRIESFIEAWRAKGQRKKRGEEVKEMIGKLDDLSDSVLQAMVWLQWNRNLRRVIDEFPELLEEIKEEDAVAAVKKPAKKKRRKAAAEEGETDDVAEIQGEEKAVVKKEKKKSTTARKKKGSSSLEEEQVGVIFEDDVEVNKTPKRSRKKKDLDVEAEPEAVVKNQSTARKNKSGASKEEQVDAVFEDDLAVKPATKRSRKKKDLVVNIAEPEAPLKGGAVKAPTKRSRKKKDSVVDVEPEASVGSELFKEEQPDIIFEDDAVVKTPTKRSRKKKDPVVHVEPEASVEEGASEPLREEEQVEVVFEDDLEVKPPVKRSRKKKDAEVEVKPEASTEGMQEDAAKPVTRRRKKKVSTEE